MLKSLLSLLSLMCCVLCSVNLVAAQVECEDDTYVVLASGAAYSVNNPDAEPLSLIPAVSDYLPEIGFVEPTTPFWMDFSSAAGMLAFTNGEGVFLLDSDSEAPQDITPTDTEEHDYVDFEALSWSPDGQFLAAAVLENPSEYNLPTRMVILIYEVTTETWREGIKVMYEELGLLSYLGMLRWSPDGTAIAFSVDTIIEIRFYTIHYFDTACFDEGNCEHSEILMRPNNNPNGIPENRYAPDWSPDNRLGFICGDDLCLFDRESRGVERVEELDIADEFAWLPCGNRIVYQHEEANLVVRDLDSGEETLLLTMPPNDYVHFQTQEIVALVPIPDAAFLFESSGA